MSANPYRVKWDLDTENGTATAILTEKTTDENGDDVAQEVSRETYEIQTLIDAGVGNFIALYGLSKILQDRSSSKSAGPEKMEEMENVFGYLREGQTKAPRSGGGGGGTSSGVPLVVEAIARIKGVSVSEASRSWKQTDKATKEAIKENDKVAKAMEEIKEERKAAESSEVDLGDLV